MMGKRVVREAKLFYTGINLEQRISPNHPLRAIRLTVDFSFVREVVVKSYGRNGHVGCDPIVVLKLLFLCFYENVRSERALLEQLPYRLDWLWFCDLDLDSPIPDHSVLSKARRRWGVDAFDAIFAQVLGQCLKAGLIDGATLHADSTLIKANASLEGRVSRWLWQQLEQGVGPSSPAGEDATASAPAISSSPQDNQAAAPSRPVAAEDTQAGILPPAPQGTVNRRLVSPADPDAAVATRKSRGPTLAFRDHRLVDDAHGIILATVATPGDYDDGSMLPVLLQQNLRYGLAKPREVVGDSMYGTRDNYTLLQEQGIKGYLKKRRGKDSPKVSWTKLLPEGCHPGRARELMRRRKTVCEGRFAESHELMGHRRCRWRRRWRVQIQCCLVAMTQNIKKLARHLQGKRGGISAAVCGGMGVFFCNCRHTVAPISSIG